jgi:PAS domain S-box-containing protein
MDIGLFGVLTWTLSGRITDANETFLGMVGYDRDDVEAGRADWLEMTPPECRDRDAAAVDEMRRTGRHRPFEKEFLRKDGSRVPVLIGSALFSGSDTEGVSFAFDLSSHREAERERRAALEALGRKAAEVVTIFESMTDAFYALDPEWRFTYLNREAESLLRRDREDLLGRVIWEEFPAVVDSTFWREYRRAAAEQVTVAFEEFYPPLSGWFEVRAYPSEAGLSVYFRDITQRRRAEEELRFLTGEARCLLWRATIRDKGGEHLAWDIAVPDEDAARQFLPITTRPGQSYTDAWYESRLPEDRERTDAFAAAEVRAGRSYSQEFRCRRADGCVRWLKEDTRVSASESGCWHAVGVVTDITELKEAYEERERLLRRVEEAAEAQRVFLREVLAGVSEGKLRLCDTPGDLPARLPAIGEPVALGRDSLRLLRHRTRDVCEAQGLDEARYNDLVTGVGEAGMNAVVHAGGGTAFLGADPVSGTVQVGIEDAGKGIAFHALHRATLERGYKGEHSPGFGHGFWLMLQTCDRVYLLTGPHGTTVVLEQERDAPGPPWVG